MSYPAQVEARNTDDTLSLTSLESGADEFDRRMIQTARDERYANDAPTPKIHAFRKARIHPRVGVTLENLERHNAKNNGALGHNSPPSSSGSTRSDPALNVPTAWGRKARVKRDWMRTITAADSQISEAQNDTVDRFPPDTVETPRRDADDIRPSIEDSPLSHKSFSYGTPASQRRRSIDDWDFDMNDASLIASTPYHPRNTVLDDIRQREIESLRDQGVTTNRLDKIRESSPEEVRRPRCSASTKSTEVKTSGTISETVPEPVSPTTNKSELRLHKRTKSWQAVGKAPAITGESSKGTPIVVYKKSSETIGAVDSRLLANQATPAMRPPRRRDDSQDLLRRLARASSTPSPGRTETWQQQPAPVKQDENSSQKVHTETARATVRKAKELPSDELNDTEKPSPQQPTNDFDATPKPAERSLFNPKTPVVTGAWVDTMIDTPGDPIQRPTSRSLSSTSPRKRSPQKKHTTKASSEEIQDQAPQVSKPDLPRSVLDAIVEEARASGRGRSTDYGDSTINSLEELITPLPDTSDSENPDEDTLALDLPTAAPRNEAERRRNEELVHIRQMDQKLRSTRTSLRDTSRGIRRVEEQMERRDDANSASTLTQRTTSSNADQKTATQEFKCPCAENGHHRFSLWDATKLLFYDASLKPRRRGWGLTYLSIFLLSFFTWFVLENICCEIWGHHMYATSYKGYGVVWGAPEYPYALPTMTYRAFIKPWFKPLSSVLLWIWRAVGGGSGDAAAQAAARASASRIAQRILVKNQERLAFEEEAASVLGMAADEVVRR